MPGFYLLHRIEVMAFYPQRWDLYAYVKKYTMGLIKNGNCRVHDTALQMMVNHEMERGGKIRVVAGVLARAQMASFLSWPWKCDPTDTHVLREQRGGHGQDWLSGRSGRGWKMSFLRGVVA